MPFVGKTSKTDLVALCDEHRQGTADDERLIPLAENRVRNTFETFGCTQIQKFIESRYTAIYVVKATRYHGPNARGKAFEFRDTKTGKRLHACLAKHTACPMGCKASNFSFIPAICKVAAAAAPAAALPAALPAAAPPAAARANSVSFKIVSAVCEHTFQILGFSCKMKIISLRAKMKIYVECA